MKGVKSAHVSSKSVQCTQNPVWDEELTLVVDDINDQSIVFAVWDKDIGKDDKIGQKTVNDKDFAIGTSGEKTLTLTKGKDEAGKLFISWRCEEAIEQGMEKVNKKK